MRSKTAGEKLGVAEFSYETISRSSDTPVKIQRNHSAIQQRQKLMSDWYQSLSDSKWDCKYHVVLVPKYRRKLSFGDIRQHLGVIFHELGGRSECRMIEGRLMPDHVQPDHVHMCIAILPKYIAHSVAGGPPQLDSPGLSSFDRCQTNLASPD